MLTQSGDLIFREPLAITRDRTILDGYARWQLARQQGRPTLPCIEHNLTEEEALLYIIQHHQRSDGLNDFSRILLALELEPWLREQARFNQQLGGQRKGSSNLTEADRLDVRSRIASAAGVSTGNLSNARRLISEAHPRVLQALRANEISIHQASIWLKTPEKQLDRFLLHQNLRGITRKIDTLLNAHSRPVDDCKLDLQRIASALAAMPPEQREAVVVAEFKTPGSVLLLSSALRQALTRQGELHP
jgi:ParB-like chromosome segregation protein Spo0J